MPRVSEMRESKFLKQSDVGAGILVTVTGCEQYNVAMQGAEHDMKWCLTFAEVDKPLVLNGINAQLLEKICGSDNTDDWMGHKCVLYTDPTVAFGGKVVGGIRVRAPRIIAKPAIAVKPAQSVQAAKPAHNPDIMVPHLRRAPVAQVEVETAEYGTVDGEDSDAPF